MTCVLAAMASPLTAQRAPAGTAVFQMTVRLPDSLKAKVPLGDSVSIQFTIATDGTRFAVGIVPGTMGSMPMLDGLSVKTIYNTGVDSLHVGILMPPSLAAMSGGGPGMRIDVSMATIDSAITSVTGKVDSSMTHAMDSVMTHMPAPVMHSLGTTSTVAGIQCENWETITATDTVSTCVIPTPPMLQALQDQMTQKAGLGKLLNKYPQLAQMQAQAYGGRHMTPIRMSYPRTGMHMELVSFTPGTPDAAQFELPAGLKPMPMPSMPGKPSTMGALNQR
jgi:hypothetical protein